MPDTHAMAERHEQHVAEVLGGARTRGSGSQWHDKGDGHTAHGDLFEWFWDCKSTLGKSLSITRVMLAKLDEEAHSGRPLLPVVFFDSDRLDVAPAGYRYLIREDDLLELIETATQQAPNGDAELLKQAVDQFREQEVGLRAKVAELKQDNSDLRREIARLQEQQAPAAEPEAPAPRSGPGPLPALPWTVIWQQQGTSRHVGIVYDAQGHPHPMEVGTVRVEPVTETTSRLMVDDQIVRAGDLYVNGRLTVRVGA